MTDKIKALVEKWRADASRDAQTESAWGDGRQEAFLLCADELESLTAVAGDALVLDSGHGKVIGEIMARIFGPSHKALTEREGIEIQALHAAQIALARQAVEGMVPGWGVIDEDGRLSKVTVHDEVKTEEQARKWFFSSGPIRSWKQAVRLGYKIAPVTVALAAAPQAGKGEP